MQSNVASIKVAKNLKILIKKSQFKTQENFAVAFGVDPSTLRRWLHNGIDSINTCDRIARLLDVNVLELLGVA